MTPDAIADAAKVLTRSPREPRLLDALPEACRPVTLDEAHAIQDGDRARLGEAIGGWKVGATPDGRRRSRRAAALAGRTKRRRSSPPLVPLLGVEAEIAFRFDRRCRRATAQYDYDEVAAAVTALPAIEVVDSRFRGYPSAAARPHRRLHVQRRVRRRCGARRLARRSTWQRSTSS